MKKTRKLLIALISLFTVIILSTGISAVIYNPIYYIDFDTILMDSYYDDIISENFLSYTDEIRMTPAAKGYGVEFANQDAYMHDNPGIFRYGDVNKYSISMWVKNYGLYEENEKGVFVAFSDYLELYFDNDNTLNFTFVRTNDSNANAEDYTITSSKKLNTNEWYYITVTHENNYLNMYVNGQAVAETKLINGVANFSVSDKSLYIGKGINGNNFKGAVDEFKYYTNTFTAAEAEEQYRKALAEATFTDHVSYPTDKTSEIESASDELWFETNRIYPMDTDYENPISSDHYIDGTLTDNAHTGRFALHIKFSSTNYAALVKCVPFSISEDTSIANGTQSVNTTNVSINEIISGDMAETMGAVNYPSVEEDVVLESLKVNGVEEKLNIVSLWVYPGKNSQYICFYLKTDDGQYLRVGGEDNSFELGRDFSLGKWQEFKLDLAKVQTSRKIVGLYMTANEGSEWDFDTVRSEYRHIKTQELNLQSAEKENLMFMLDKGLLFDFNGAEFNIDPVITEIKFDNTDIIHSVNANIGYVECEMGNEVSVTDDDNSYTLTNNIRNITTPVYISQNGRFVYYIDKSTNGQLVYIKTDDIGTQTSVLDTNYSFGDFTMSQNGEHIYCGDGLGHYNNETKQYSYSTSNKWTTDNDKYISNLGNIYTYTSSTNRFSGLNCDVGIPYQNGAIFSDNDEYIFIYENSSSYESYVLKKSGEEYLVYQTLNINVSDEPFFDKTAEHIYYGNYCIDIETGANYPLDITGTALCNYKDNKVVYQSSNKYVIYDPITTEKEVVSIITYNKDNVIRYNEAIDAFVYFDKKDMSVGVRSMIKNSSSIKFLLSFNENNVWYTYDNGFKIVSYGEKATHQTYKEYGMTAEQLSAISFDKFEEFHKEKNIMSVKIGIRISAIRNTVSPAIKKLSVNTVPNDSAEYLYATRIAKFDKDDYSSINSTFPTETFADETEAYYYFYLGNDWLYTIRNNKLALIGKSADDLFGDVESNWMYIKYTGMTLGEMRSVSIEELNSLFLNPEYANTEFGIISVLRTKGNKTEDAKMEFKFNMNEKHLSTEGSFVAEILMNDGTTISFTSEDVGNEEIEKFLVWFANVQMGNGSEFYCLKTANGIRYVNYRLIIGVNILENASVSTLADDNNVLPSELDGENASLSDIDEVNTDTELTDGEIIEPIDTVLPDIPEEETV